MQSIEIDFYKPEDAPGVARLFQEVYGEGYPVRIYYSPDRLTEENAARRIISTVARTSEGEIIGHDALVLLDSATHLYENAAGAVLPTFRGHGIFFRLMKHSILDAAKRFGVEEILGEPVCNHLHLQKMCTRLDYTESGLEVDLMPAAAYTKEQSAQGRVSVLLGYFLHKRVPRTVYLPPVYRDALEYLYTGMGVERAFAESEKNLPTACESQGKAEMFAAAQVLRMVIHSIGQDFEIFVRHQENQASEKGTEVFQIWLPLTSPFTAAATYILRMHGYSIGGLLPGWFNGDGLLMQKAMGETDWDGIALYSERARKIAEIIRNDQEEVRYKS